MGWDSKDPYKYYPERGLYYHEVWDRLICGSQPQTKRDVDQLADLLGSKGSIFSLQQDRDLAYWNVDIHSLQAQAAIRGIKYLRHPAKDFSGESLRYNLPGAAMGLHEELRKGSKVYLHCTAGLGRAPAVCIAYLYWFHEFQLQDAYSHVTNIRPCGPNWDAIRGATYDLLDGRGWEAFAHLPAESYTELNASDKENLKNHLEHIWNNR